MAAGDGTRITANKEITSGLVEALGGAIGPVIEEMRAIIREARGQQGSEARGDSNERITGGAPPNRRSDSVRRRSHQGYQVESGQCCRCVCAAARLDVSSDDCDVNSTAVRRVSLPGPKLPNFTGAVTWEVWIIGGCCCQAQVEQ